MKRRKTCLVITLLICLGAGALPAHTLLSPRRSWPSLPINIVVDAKR